jgi:hypothetical protein
MSRIYFYLGQLVRVTVPPKDARGRALTNQLARIVRLSATGETAVARIGRFRFHLEPTECEEIAPARRIHARRKYE